MMSGEHPEPGLHLVPDDADQVLRLAAFREAHPGAADIGCGDGYWQATVPGADGETVITRHQLRDLLDALDELLG